MQVIYVPVFFQYKKKEWTELTIRPSLKTFSIPKPIASHTCRGFSVPKEYGTPCSS